MNLNENSEIDQKLSENINLLWCQITLFKIREFNKDNERQVDKFNLVLLKACEFMMKHNLFFLCENEHQEWIDSVFEFCINTLECILNNYIGSDDTKSIMHRTKTNTEINENSSRKLPAEQAMFNLHSGLSHASLKVQKINKAPMGIERVRSTHGDENKSNNLSISISLVVNILHLNFI